MNMQKLLENKQVWFRILLAMLIISISFGYCQVEEPEKVHYFSYTHLTENLENIVYDGHMDQYTITGAPASVTCNLGMKIKPVKYLYLELHTSVEQPTNWTLGYINSKGEMVIKQQVVLNEGKNEIALKNNTLWQLRLIPDLAAGVSFKLDNVELRNTGKDFLAKKFLFYCAAAFVSMAVLVFVWIKKGLAKKCKDLVEEMQQNVDAFLKVLAETVTWKFSGWIKRLIRSALFLVILIYITYIQHRGVDDLISYFSMHMWIVGGILLVLTGLVYENREYEKDHSLLKYVMLLYLAFIWISDFYLNKKFRYAGFGMVFFGGFFARAWRSMENPDELMEDFKLAYKMYFLLGTMLCLAFRPTTAGIHYSGFFTEAVSFGIMMLIALVVFISDMLLHPVRIWNGAGALAALFFVWKTQKLTIVLIAEIVIIAGAIFWLVSWLKAKGRDKIKSILCLVVTAVLGIVCVLVLKKLTGALPYKIGMQKTFAMDVVETYDLGLMDSLRQNGWKTFFYDKIQICKTYLQYTNFWGHANLTKYFDETIWPSNSVVMNMFRYGMVAGIAYGLMTVLYLIKSVTAGVRKGNFQVLALAIVGVLAAMTEVVERTFTNLGWYVVWFGLCYCWTLRRSKAIKNC